MNVDLSELAAFLMDGGELQITIHVKAIPSSAPLHHTARCECGWVKRYASKTSAVKGLKTHQHKYCTGKPAPYPSWIQDQHEDGA